MRLERATGWLSALIVSCAATGIALHLQNILRSIWQVRTLPERVMEWLLLFVPLDLFEKGLQQLGTDAKVLAQAGAFVGMAVVLLAIGALVLRVGWPGWLLLGLGPAMWLFSMIVIMPITGAGLFGSGLLISPVLTSAGYLLVFLGYASVLVGGRLLVRRSAISDPRRKGAIRYPRHQPLMADRRAFMAGAIGALLAGGATWFAGRQGGLVGSSLPLATAPTRQPATPVSPPLSSEGTVGAAPTVTPASGSTTASTAAAVAASPTLPPLPDPPLPRRLARDDGGSLTAAGRPKGQLAPPITSNSDFYIVTKNAVADPVIDAASWRLVIDGEVNRPVQVDYRTLSGLPSVELTKTLECISNFTAGCSLTNFGCDLMSTAVWKGVRLSDVLDLAGGLKSSAVGLAFLAADEFSAGLRSDIVDDPESLIVYEMNGQPLPREHGFPMRLLVPGRYGMKNPKWLAGIRAMNQEYAGWYEQRNWDRDGIVKTMARIDLPIDGATLDPGEQRVAGMAYAGDRGVRQVDISPDDGVTWLPMRLLEPMPGKDAMVRWDGTFMLPSDASITLTVRATDGTGAEQVDEFQLPQPDGASGRDQVTVNAA
jgi:DMSO/TMAO reductase YedYZ molybdopterin-dependent catalytic subunit